MKGHGTQYKRKKDQAIAALLTERTIADAARVIDVGTKTLKRWMKIPEFENELLAARRERYQQTTARFEQNTNPAAHVILQTMADPKVAASVRLKAAQFVWFQAGEAINATEVLCMERRISDLESVAKDLKRAKELGGTAYD
jgi:hypothetical protein